MSNQAFSYREESRHIPDTLNYQDLSDRVRTGICTELLLALPSGEEEVAQASHKLYEIACRHTRSLYNPVTNLWSFEVDVRASILPFFESAEWFEVLDILDEWLPIAFASLHSHLNREFLDRLVNFKRNLNKLFVEEGVGWEIHDNNKVQRRQSPVTDSRIRETAILLRDPKFRPANQLWAKAVDALNYRPEPDIENCVKDAVAAVEATANIALLRTGLELDDAVDQLAAQARIPKPLHNTLKRPYHYSGNQPGVRHGSGKPLSARVEDAEFVLNWAAAAIIYLSKV